LRRDPKVTILVYPADHPQESLEVRGEAAVVEDAGGDLIQALSRKYTGNPFDGDAGTDNERVMVRSRPAHVSHRNARRTRAPARAGSAAHTSGRFGPPRLFRRLSPTRAGPESCPSPVNSPA